MIDVLATGLVIAGLLFAGVSVVTALLNRAPGTVLVGIAAVVELALLVQLVAAVVLLIGGERPAEFATFLAYLVASVLIVPVAVLWAASERNRWSSVVLGVSGLVIVVLVLRLQQVWAGA
ncbi:hypothetical protein [Actinopolymorpha alba]|uniref:hypothetical protein n=1 Tax=Actinopolymorpha alba TaxID=533267 RepID=UPI00035E1691|nr:hypothetical protein [Actinopolymorpha alba]